MDQLLLLSQSNCCFHYLFISFLQRAMMNGFNLQDWLTLKGEKYKTVVCGRYVHSRFNMCLICGRSATVWHKVRSLFPKITEPNLRWSVYICCVCETDRVKHEWAGAYKENQKIAPNNTVAETKQYHVYTIREKHLLRSEVRLNLLRKFINSTWTGCKYRS